MNTAQLIARAAESSCSDRAFPLNAWKAYAEDRSAIHAALDALPSDHLSLFTALVRVAGPLPFDESKLDQWHHIDLPSAYIRALLPRLQRAGLIAVFRKTWGERIYSVPSDIYEVVVERMLDRAIQASSESAPVLRDASCLQPLADHESIEAGEGLTAAVFQLLIRAAKDGLPMTAKGLLHKKTLQRIEQELKLQESLLGAFKLVSNVGVDSMSITASITLDAALRLGLLRKARGGYELANEIVGEWLRKSITEWRRAWFQIAVEQYMPAHASIKHLLVGLAAVGQDGDWTCADHVSDLLQRQQWYTNTERLEADSSDVLRAWIRAAHAIGICDAGEDSAGRIWYRWLAPLASPEQLIQKPNEGLFVQPDFEIMVPPNSSLLMRWELEMIAERGASTPMLTYRLTRSACQQAIEHGRNLEWQIQFLEQHALTGVPDHVKEAILQWASQYGHVHFAEVMLLRARDSASSAIIAQEVASNPDAGLIAIGPLDYIVERSRLDRLRSKLEQLGLTPLKKVVSTSEQETEKPLLPVYWQPAQEVKLSGAKGDVELDGESQNGSSAKGKVYSPSALQYYEMDTTLLEDDVLAQFRQLPTMWTNSVRSYHASTMRELVDSAIRCKLPMLVKDHFLGEMTVLPLSSKDARSDASNLSGDQPTSWSVSVERVGEQGVESIILMADTWDGVRVLLPGWMER